MIEIRELVIRVNVTENVGEAREALSDESIAALRKALLDACEERIEAALRRGVER